MSFNPDNFASIEHMCGDLHETFSLEGLGGKKPIPMKIKLPVIPMKPVHPHPRPHPHPHIRPLRPIRVRRGPIFVPGRYMPRWWNRVPLVRDVVVRKYNDLDMYVILTAIAIGGVVIYQTLRKH
jgi:hypothetical protein